MRWFCCVAAVAVALAFAVRKEGKAHDERRRKAHFSPASHCIAPHVAFASCCPLHGSLAFETLAMNMFASPSVLVAARTETPPSVASLRRAAWAYLPTYIHTCIPTNARDYPTPTHLLSVSDHRADPQKRSMVIYALCHADAPSAFGCARDFPFGVVPRCWMTERTRIR